MRLFLRDEGKPTCNYGGSKRLSSIKKIISLLMIVVFVLMVFVPATVSAQEEKDAPLTEELMAKSENVLYSVRGEQASLKLYNELTSRNIEVKEDTLIEVVTMNNQEGTAILATNTEGSLITRSALMGIKEDGQLKAFSDAEIAALRTDLHGGNATIDPFDDTFTFVFIATFYAYWYNHDSEGLVQPQTAMYIYYDPDSLYTVSSFSMEYRCAGVEGYFDGTNFTAISGPLETYTYSIPISQTMPRKNTYYSNNDPINANKAVMVAFEPGGHQYIHFDLRVVRKDDLEPIRIWDNITLNTHLT